MQILVRMCAYKLIQWPIMAQVRGLHLEILPAVRVPISAFN